MSTRVVDTATQLELFVRHASDADRYALLALSADRGFWEARAARQRQRETQGGSCDQADDDDDDDDDGDNKEHQAQTQASHYDLKRLWDAHLQPYAQPARGAAGRLAVFLLFPDDLGETVTGEDADVVAAFRAARERWAPGGRTDSQTRPSGGRDGAGAAPRCRIPRHKLAEALAVLSGEPSGGVPLSASLGPDVRARGRAASASAEPPAPASEPEPEPEDDSEIEEVRVLEARLRGDDGARAVKRRRRSSSHERTRVHAVPGSQALQVRQQPQPVRAAPPLDAAARTANTATRRPSLPAPYLDPPGTSARRVDAPGARGAPVPSVTESVSFTRTFGGPVPSRPGHDSDVLYETATRSASFAGPALYIGGPAIPPPAQGPGAVVPVGMHYFFQGEVTPQFLVRRLERRYRPPTLVDNARPAADTPGVTAPSGPELADWLARVRAIRAMASASAQEAVASRSDFGGRDGGGVGYWRRVSQPRPVMQYVPTTGAAQGNVQPWLENPATAAALRYNWLAGDDNEGWLSMGGPGGRQTQR